MRPRREERRTDQKLAQGGSVRARGPVRPRVPSRGRQLQAEAGRVEVPGRQARGRAAAAAAGSGDGGGGGAERAAPLDPEEDGGAVRHVQLPDLAYGRRRAQTPAPGGGDPYRLTERRESEAQAGPRWLEFAPGGVRGRRGGPRGRPPGVLRDALRPLPAGQLQKGALSSDARARGD